MSQSDPELDAELSELFDQPAPPRVPLSPPPPASPPNKRSLLHALHTNALRLSRSAASRQARPVRGASPSHAPPAAPLDGASHAPARDAPSAQPETRPSEASAPPSAKHLISKRIAEKKATPHPRRPRSTSAPMQIVSAARNKPLTSQHQQHSFHDRKTSNISLTDSPFSSATLEALFEHCTRVDVAELALKSDQMREGSIKSPVVFGVVVEKHSKKRAKDGSTYAVWTLYNMPRYQREGCSPTSVLLLLFGAAFERWHNVVPGAAFALRKPVLLPPRMAEKQQVRGVCLKVSTEKQLVYLGVSADYAFCEALRKDGTACGKWYDANRLSMCSTHRAQKLRKLTSSNRMDVNNAVRPMMKQPQSTEERKLSSVVPTESENLRQRLSVPRNNKYQQKDKKRIRRLKDSRHNASSTSNTKLEHATILRRKQYTNAVYTLQNLGFTLDEHGSLLAPQQACQATEFGPLVKRARTQAKAAAPATAAPAQCVQSAVNTIVAPRITDAQGGQDGDKPQDTDREREMAQLMQLSDESESDSEAHQNAPACRARE